MTTFKLSQKALYLCMNIYHVYNCIEMFDKGTPKCEEWSYWEGERNGS